MRSRRRTAPLPMALPVVRLAEAHTRLVRGYHHTATASALKLGRHPIPWLLGFNDPEDATTDTYRQIIIVEPWAALKAIHRRKNGFSRLRERFEALELIASVQFNGAAIAFEIWQDAPSEPLDESLIDKLEPRLAGPLERFPATRFPEVLSAVERAITPDLVSDTNPLVAVLAWTDTIRPPAH